ncbi:unnamed protein product [Clonostachys rosea f. rosea IK726]|uniref:Uncharacterized protein n=1 Tax=Clonostachys rosea f. rosea IK726 TaxID=1349383 RepID=A0ACA9U823_BIOOC|nr:unnamed protein product [Clonostachys rosea f. rosea IK726]
MSGLFMQIFASGIIGLLLFARIWAGLGAGILTVVSPLYLSEIAPTKSRGMVVTVYMVFLLSFLMFFINFGANKGLLSGRMQYRLVQAIPLIPVGLALVGSFFLSDTPRWLASKDALWKPQLRSSAFGNRLKMMKPSLQSALTSRTGSSPN